MTGIDFPLQWSDSGYVKAPKPQLSVFIPRFRLFFWWDISVFTMGSWDNFQTLSALKDNFQQLNSCFAGE
jgi:hypothetical protein